VIKSGRVMVERGVLPDIRSWFQRHYTIQFANYPVADRYLSHGGVEVPGRGWGETLLFP
jgi:formylmethanofuran dehydrogenase subunit A